MRSKFKWIFTLLVALAVQVTFAQEKTVTGVVSDAQGPLPGANVVVKGTNRGTQTDIDGKYSIQAKAGEVLLVTFVGMSDKTVTVGAANTYNVTLSSGVTLETLVIDGYKTTTKRKAAVAQTTLTAESVENRPNVSFLQSLQSQVSGLNIATSSGTPGSAKIDVVLRGWSSVNGSTEPLYVIDGVAANQVVFRALNSEDIQSITVLKDAGATAIYGNRGANGVIVITTKKGKYDSKLQVRYSGSTGYTTLQDHDYNLTNSHEILTLQHELGVGLGGSLTTDQINAYQIDTNWKDYFFRTGLSRSHTLSLTQGSKNLNNYTSIGYFDQDGIVPTTDFKRFSLRSNFQGKSNDERFTYTTNLGISWSKRHQLDQETRTDINANVLQNPLQGLLSSLPYIDPSLYVNGQQLADDFGAPSFEIIPYMLLDYIQPGNIPNLYDETKIAGQLAGSYKLTDNLTYTGTFGLDYAQNNRDFARAPWSYLAIIATPTGAEYGGIERQNTIRDLGINYQNRLNYLKTFGSKHTLDVNLFTEYVRAFYRSFQYTQSGLDPRTWSLGSGTGYIGYDGQANSPYVPTVSAQAINTGLFSYFMTADYDFDQRFGVAATIRRDASYRFIDDKRWGTFWSVSGRWNIDSEKFMQNSWFDQLKLRGSYGLTGNQNIVAAGYGVNPLFTATNLTRDLVSSGGVGYNGDAGAFVGQIGNPDLQWEVTKQADIGLDFSIKKRLSGTLDFYLKRTDHLFDQGYISSINGTQFLDTNVDYLLYNRGVELSLNYDVFKKGDFKLNVNANGSYNKNYLKSVVYDDPNADENAFGNVYNANGDPLYAYFLVPYVGVNHENGNLLFLDKDNNLTENPTDADRRKTGKSALPTYQGGFGFDMSYKGFFINTNFSWVADVYKFDFDLTNLSDPSQIGQFPVVGELTHAWNPTNTSSNVPSLTATNIESASTYSDRFLVDASYIRLKNASVGYDVPKKFLDKTAFSGVKFYVQFENFLTWSKWRGFDVEGLNSSNQGGYPSPKVASFGVDVSL